MPAAPEIGLEPELQRTYPQLLEPRQQPRLGDEAVAVVGRDDALLRLDSGRR
jgi:hypothetical protein